MMDVSTLDEARDLAIRASNAAARHQTPNHHKVAANAWDEVERVARMVNLRDGSKAIEKAERIAQNHRFMAESLERFGHIPDPRDAEIERLENLLSELRAAVEEATDTLVFVPYMYRIASLLMNALAASDPSRKES